MKSNFRLTILVFVLAAAAAGQRAPRLVAVADGWARNQINAVVFRKNSVTSFRGFQYVAFYDAASRVAVGRRRLGASAWEIKTTAFTGNTADAHNSISLAVDGRGYLHLAWDHHNSPLRYSRSVRPETLEFAPPGPMVGTKEARVSYPEFYNLPGGDLLFFYRDGGSGDGDLVLDHYDAKRQVWSRRQDNLIAGEGRRSAYPQAAVDRRGTIHLSWVWRETPDAATNHDLCYARSRDGGRTWERTSGERYALPIDAARAEYARRIPQKSELINQTSMTADAAGRPLIATYWRAAGETVPQYRIVRFDGRQWRDAAVSARTTPFTLSGGGTKRIPLARPQIVARGRGAVLIFRDEERARRVSAAVCGDLEKNVWATLDLTAEDVGFWEPSLDQNLWNRRGELNLFVQKVGQGDGETLEALAPQTISILEWKP